ncbi:MAG: helix-turn-helix domain-containing protein [Pyrinomonadaceae bacterium]|nr:helix-turn-helix domain-containing protein [Acidobacteriota bacterium]
MEANRTIDAKKYGRLLSKALPSVVKSEKENEQMLAEIEQLIDKGDERSPEEDTLLELLCRLVEDFEERAYPVDDAPPHEVLQHLMEARDLKQADLAPVLGTRGRVSEIVNGKRAISKAQAKALGEFFHVSPSLFI